MSDDEVSLRPQPRATGDPLATLPNGTELLVIGPAVETEGTVWWPVEDPMSLLSGYVVDDAVEPSDPTD